MLNCVYFEKMHKILVHDIEKVRNCRLRRNIEIMHEIHTGIDDKLITDKMVKNQTKNSSNLEVTTVLTQFQYKSFKPGSFSRFINIT